MGPTSAEALAIASADQRVFMWNMPWSHYEVMLALRGDAAVPRLTYLRGTLELMTPSEGHESTKKTIARLVEAYAEEIGVDLWAYGSWTLKSAPKERGAEPDECYVLKAPQARGVPDLAIEVAWTHGGLDKLEIYSELGVSEVWMWADGKISVHVLKVGAYEEVPRSVAFPDLDLDLVARLATHPNPSQAVRELRAHVRAKRGGANK